MITRFMDPAAYEDDRLLRVAGKINRLEYTRRRAFARTLTRDAVERTQQRAALDFLGKKFGISGLVLSGALNYVGALISPKGSDERARFTRRAEAEFGEYVSDVVTRRMAAAAKEAT